jgi:molybdopterin adenylyltransferase
LILVNRQARGVAYQRVISDTLLRAAARRLPSSRWFQAFDMNQVTRPRSGRRTGIDESLPFHPLAIAVLTISDTRTEATDTSGALLIDRLRGAGHRLAGHVIVPDEVAAIQRQLATWVEDPRVDVIVTTGGTGFSPRDVTPEAVRPLLRREMDGFAAVFHQASHATVGVSTLQSRALAGQIDDTFIFCVPGSTGACRDAWDLVLAAEFDSRFRPCSLVGQVPRYRGVCA